MPRLARSFSLPIELQTELPNPWISRAINDAKRCIADVATWVIELRVIEDVEELHPNVESQVFSDDRML